MNLTDKIKMVAFNAFAMLPVLAILITILVILNKESDTIKNADIDKTTKKYFDYVKRSLYVILIGGAILLIPLGPMFLPTILGMPYLYAAMNAVIMGYLLTIALLFMRNYDKIDKKFLWLSIGLVVICGYLFFYTLYAIKKYNSQGGIMADAALFFPQAAAAQGVIQGDPGQIIAANPTARKILQNPNVQLATQIASTNPTARKVIQNPTVQSAIKSN